MSGSKLGRAFGLLNLQTSFPMILVRGFQLNTPTGDFSEGPRSLHRQEQSMLYRSARQVALSSLPMHMPPQMMHEDKMTTD